MKLSVLLPMLALLLAACGGPRTYAEREDFRSDPRYRREFAAAPAPVCDAARRALLSDGYLLGSGEEHFGGAKEFQIDDKSHALLRIYVTCVARGAGSSLFVTATEEHFDVKTIRQSTSVGLPLVSPLSIGKEIQADSQVQTHGETVTDRGFYDRFYQAVERELGR